MGGGKLLQGSFNRPLNIHPCPLSGRGCQPVFPPQPNCLRELLGQKLDLLLDFGDTAQVITPLRIR